MKIIGLAGRKQSGKSTSCEFIVRLINQLDPKISSKIYSFADSLKTDICINILGLTYNQCYGTDEDKNTLTSLRWKDMPEYNITWTYTEDYDPSGYMTARQVMEFVGTSIFRRMKNNVWSESTIKKIQLDHIDIALISDCRFPNEVESIQNAGGMVIRLTKDLYGSQSESESSLDYQFFDWSKFDYVLDNANLDIEQKNSLIKQFLTDKGIIQL